jgi:hypothetical protein
MQFSDNPTIETPEGDAHRFNVRYQVGRAAHACLCSPSEFETKDSASDSAKVHSALHHLFFVFAKGTVHQLR